MAETSAVQQALGALADAFRALGYGVAEAGGRIPFPPLALEFRIADVTFYPASGDSLVQLVVEAAPAGDPRDGVRVNAVGFGPTDADALRYAADQWLDGVFPVLHRWRAPHDAELGVVSREMIVADTDTGRRFGWRAHLGPTLFTHFAREGDAEPSLDALPDQEAVLLALLEELSPRSAHQTVFWVEAYAGRVPGRPPQATCLLRNGEWPEGEAALLAWAAGHPALAGIGMRQFLLFEPARPDALAGAESLTRTLEAELDRSRERGR